MLLLFIRPALSPELEPLCSRLCGCGEGSRMEPVTRTYNGSSSRLVTRDEKEIITKVARQALRRATEQQQQQQRHNLDDSAIIIKEDD